MLRICSSQALFETLASGCLSKQDPSLLESSFPLPCDPWTILSLGNGRGSQASHSLSYNRLLMVAASFLHAAEPYKRPQSVISRWTSSLIRTFMFSLCSFVRFSQVL